MVEERETECIYTVCMDACGIPPAEENNLIKDMHTKYLHIHTCICTYTPIHNHIDFSLSLSLMSKKNSFFLNRSILDF